MKEIKCDVLTCKYRRFSSDQIDKFYLVPVSPIVDSNDYHIIINDCHLPSSILLHQQ